MRQDDEPVRDGDRFIDTERFHHPDLGAMKFTVRCTEADGIELHYDDGDVFGPFSREEFNDARDYYTQTDPETGETIADLREEDN
jgi:hypothetical protein